MTGYVRDQPTACWKPDAYYNVAGLEIDAPSLL